MVSGSWKIHTRGYEKQSETIHLHVTHLGTKHNESVSWTLNIILISKY